jgi:hypothetical protein
MGMKFKTLESLFIILVIATKPLFLALAIFLFSGGKLPFSVCAPVFLSNSLLIPLTICVQDPTSINADPDTSDSSEWECRKRKCVSETIEHGSLSVISAKFEVSL